MSQEVYKAPENPAHWSDQWQPFHDHWEEILNLPMDALEIAKNENESDEGLMRDHWMYPAELERLDRRRDIVDELVSKGVIGKTLKDAIKEIWEIYNRGGEFPDTIHSVLMDVFRPYMHSRINEKAMQEMRSDEAYKRFEEEISAAVPHHEPETMEEKDEYFLSALATATALKLGMSKTIT